MTRRLLVALCVLATAPAGCGLGPGEPQAGAPAEIRVTRDFGQQRLVAERLPRPRAGQTVLRALDGAADVETRYGGRFVQSVNGIEGEGAGGRRDWFYYVNGFESGVGAAERTIEPGEVVQWDYRRWDGAMHVRAIVGAFPEPFRSGVAGKRLPVRVECEDDGSPACDSVKSRLRDLGVPATGGALGNAAGPGLLRVVVARWAVARTVKAATTLERGPERSGVFARFSRRELLLLGPGGRRARVAPLGSGLVAAVRPPGQRPVWLVTGLDSAGVERAAAALDARTLRDAYAVAVTPTGPLRLPLSR